MTEETLLTKRINNGQSEVWFAAQPDSRRIVATNSVLYPIRTTCSAEEADAFLQALNVGTATVPVAVNAQLIADFALSLPR